MMIIFVIYCVGESAATAMIAEGGDLLISLNCFLVEQFFLLPIKNFKIKETGDFARVKAKFNLFE